MDATQYNYLKDEIQKEIDKLEKMEGEAVKGNDYANALYCFHHRLGLQHAFQIIIKSENTFNP